MKLRNILLAILTISLGFCVLQLASVSSAQTRGPSSLSAKPLTGPLVERRWATIVNNSFLIPNGTRNFSSYGQPSVNRSGTVVFRARSTMGTHETGIYIREFPKGLVRPLADTNSLVPEPNNLDTNFREFSSFPRMAINAPDAVFRGLHSPVYTYMLPDGTETRVGTTGLYASIGSDLLRTGAAKLGAVPGFDFYSVPSALTATTDTLLPFDVFPGGSAINDEGAIVFKGNWTENGVGKTGIFVRRLYASPYGGFEPTTMLASSDTEIPNMPPSFAAVTFDSTSPPSVAGNYAVFLGLDNELDPHYGGIYRVSLKGGPLEPLVEIGKVLPNSKVSELIRIGEGLSYDGRYLAFWAAWGTEFRTIRLNCPVDGNKGLIDYCNGLDPNSRYDPTTRQWFQLHQVPVEQGIVVMDTQTGMEWVISSTNGDFNDFVYWTYSGHVPGDDSDETSEPPRWRGASFMAVSDGSVVFKARTATLNEKLEYVDIVDGLYAVDAPMSSIRSTLIETGMDGNIIDPSLVPGTMPVTGVGIERDGFRGKHLAIAVTMANEEAGWGGIYLTELQRGPTLNAEETRGARKR
jgi:hypothetical protein